MTTIRKCPEKKQAECELLVEKTLEARRERDAAYADRDKAIKDAEEIKRELVTTKMRFEKLRNRKVKSVILPAIVMAVLFGISMLAHWATETLIIVPSVGDGVRITFGICATFFAGIVWERAGVRWPR